MERRKNPAAYMVSLSAVKKTQKEKSGIASTIEESPNTAASFGFLTYIRARRLKIKIIS